MGELKRKSPLVRKSRGKREQAILLPEKLRC
jgi:hypothetical protein